MQESILNNPSIQNWVYMSNEYVDFHHKKNNKNYKELALLEKASLGTCVEHKGTQWSNTLGETIVFELLKSYGCNVRKKTKVVINGRTYIPDLETDYAYFEVKTRNYSTPGTSGEKILGTPFKYIDIPKETGKPVFIVLVGFQEYEGIHIFNLFDKDTMSPNKRHIIDMFNDKKIHYIGASQLWDNLFEEYYGPTIFQNYNSYS